MERRRLRGRHTLRIRYALQRLKAPKTQGESASDAKQASGFHLVEPKTKQSRRTIAIPKLTLSALAAHKAQQSAERQVAGSAWQSPVLTCEGSLLEVGDLVFLTRFGNPFDAPTITHRFQALLTRAPSKQHWVGKTYLC